MGGGGGTPGEPDTKAWMDKKNGRKENGRKGESDHDRDKPELWFGKVHSVGK